MQHELELVDRIAQLADQRQAPAVVTALLVDRIDAEATSGTLGRVHGDVSATRQRIGVVGMLREDGDPNTHVDRDRLVVDRDRLADGLHDFFRDQHRPRDIRRAPGHHGKLVSTVAGNGIRLAQHAPHSVAHLSQETVTHLVAEAVIHALESVEVHEEERARFHLALAGTNRFFQAFAEKRAVGEPRQRIVKRLILERLGFGFAFGDVAQAADYQSLRPEPADVELHGEGHAIFSQADRLVASHREEPLLSPQVGP